MLLLTFESFARNVFGTKMGPKNVFGSKIFLYLPKEILRDEVDVFS